MTNTTDREREEGPYRVEKDKDGFCRAVGPTPVISKHWARQSAADQAKDLNAAYLSACKLKDEQYRGIVEALQAIIGAAQQEVKDNPAISIDGYRKGATVRLAIKAVDLFDKALSLYTQTHEKAGE